MIFILIVFHLENNESKKLLYALWKRQTTVAQWQSRGHCRQEKLTSVILRNLVSRQIEENVKALQNSNLWKMSISDIDTILKSS